jgi:glycosyltransferase involved in cell wall biosynthesis
MKAKQTIVITAHDVGGQGGMERHLEELIMRLKNEAHVIVVAASMKLPDPSGVRFIRIPVISRPTPLKMVLFALLATIRIWFLSRDVLHTTGAIVFNRADVSTVHFCHAGYMRDTGDIRTQMKGSIWRRWNSRLASSFARWMERRVYRPSRTKRMVAVSNRVRTEILDSFPFSLEEVEVVPNGVNIERFRPFSALEKSGWRVRYGLPADGTHLLFMGGDWHRKGLPFIVEAFSLLARDYPSLHLTVIGKGDSEIYTSMLAPELAEQIHFAGIRPDPEIWFGMSDIFVFPSSYETFSLVVHEAAASGLAVLTAKVGGVEDLMEDGVHGYFIERSSEHIAGTLRRLLQNPELGRRCGERARQRVAELTWDNTYRSMQAVYQRCSNHNESESGGHTHEEQQTETAAT